MRDLISIKHGYAFPGTNIIDTPTESVLLTPGNFRIGGGFKGGKLKYYRGETPKEYILQPGDLIVTMTDLSKNMDTLGFPARVPHFGDRRALHNQRLGLVTAVRDSVHLDFIYYLMCTAGYREEVLATSTGTTVHHTSPNRILDYDFPLPPLAEQRGIAATLGAIDDKIESNRRAVDIEFRLASVLMLGSGGRRVRLGDVAVVAKGLSYKGSGLADDAAIGAMKMINLANFTTTGQLNPSGLKHYTGEYKPKHILAELDLVVANTDLTQAREILGRGFLVPPGLAGAIHTHHTSVVRFLDGQEWMAPFLWAHLQSPEFRERAKGFATGTTVTALPSQALLDFEFTLPLDPPPVADRALALVRHGWQLTRQIDSLVSLRDALLPALLAGRIRVPEAEQAIAEVGA